MSEQCCDPNAPIAMCFVCGKNVRTCQRETPTEDGSYCCPAHPDGAQLPFGQWVCSARCWEYHIGTK
jgi:hypothetical protein